MRSADAVEQFGEGDAETARELDERPKPWLTVASLQKSDLGPM